jgi:hypothetical protein
LSISGQYARFGKQAARALEVWADWHGAVELVIEDDESSRRTLHTVLPSVAARSDVLLGPYSTQLARAAAQLATQEGWLLWNQGGSGDDVETDYPGHCVSILSPTSRYGDPFLRHLADADAAGSELWIVRATGSFGRQVAEGAQSMAADLRIGTRVVTAEQFESVQPSAPWNLLSVGRFEDDIATVRRAHSLSTPPSTICTVAAGVREFADHLEDPEGIYGIAQWFPGNPMPPMLGPAEADFLRAYGAQGTSMPDYPAVQAVAGAVIAEHCVAQAGGTARDALPPP